MLCCVRLLTVRFSLKLRLKEEDYFKSLICNAKVGKSKTKSTIKSICGKHPLWGLHGLVRLQTTVYSMPHLWCAVGWRSETLYVAFRSRQSHCLGGDSFPQPGW